MEKISDKDWEKMVGQARGQFRGVFQVFNELGHQVFIPRAIEECVEICVNFSMRARGKDVPIIFKRRNSR